MSLDAVEQGEVKEAWIVRFHVRRTRSIDTRHQTPTELSYFSDNVYHLPIRILDDFSMTTTKPWTSKLHLYYKRTNDEDGATLLIFSIMRPPLHDRPIERIGTHCSGTGIAQRITRTTKQINYHDLVSL